jgi:hypothetical protein
MRTEEIPSAAKVSTSTHQTSMPLSGLSCPPAAPSERLSLRTGVPPSFDRQLPRQLGCEDVDRLDDRPLGQQLGCLGHQGGRHLAAKVGLAAGVHTV